MLDVHPPHEPLHGWRDFLLHILTITIGLLIALSLEAAVEWFHHRHLVAEARENIHREIAGNRQLLPQNLTRLHEDAARMKANIVVIRELRDHPHAAHGKLVFNLGWSSFTDAAWRTARDTGALSYMPYIEVQNLSQLYTQQGYINTLGATLFTDQSKAPNVLLAENSLEDLQLDQLAQLMTNTTAVAAQIDLLDGLLPPLGQSYAELEKAAGAQRH